MSWLLPYPSAGFVAIGLLTISVRVTDCSMQPYQEEAYYRGGGRYSWIKHPVQVYPA